jgi:sn-glycerol 3-phosphate transport system substrate-binding protein
VISRRTLLAALSALPIAACERDADRAGRNVAALWFTYGGRNRQVLEKLVSRFNASQREHFIEAVFQGDYYEGLAKLRTAIAARSPPALSHVVGEVVPYLDYAGVLEPFDGYSGAGALDLVPALGQAGSWISGAERPTVALPFNRSTPICYLNGDLFESEGRAAPTTWAELRETARALTVQSGKRTTRYGFACPIDWWFWVALLEQAGGQVVEPDGKPSLGGEAGIRALEFWQTLVNADRTMKPPPGRDYNAWEATNQDYLAGRVAMIWTSTAFLRYLEDNAPFKVVAAPLPRLARYAVPTGGTHWILLKSAPAAEKQSAWAFLRFMHEPEQVITWATDTGYLPTTRAAVARLEASGYYQKLVNDRVAYEQLSVAVPWPWSRELFRIQRETVQPRLENAVLAGKNARALLETARAEVQGNR